MTYRRQNGNIAKIVALLLCHFVPLTIMAQQWDEYVGSEKLKPLKGLEYKAEAQISVSDGKTPLWLNVNKHGLSSLEGTNGYTRAAVQRPLQMDSIRHWGIGYGVDVAVPFNYTSDVVVQQAYGELRWLHGVLTVGSKEWPMAMKNQQLSSGSQAFGINARPVPQVRLALPDYWVVPFTKGWVRLKGHIAYGWMTDEHWQHNFTQRKHKYADDVRSHSKAGDLMIVYPVLFLPL